MQFKNLTTFSIALLLTAAGINPAAVASDNKPQETPLSFRQAKVYMVRIFKQLKNSTSLYCGCPIKFTKKGGYLPELDACGYVIQSDVKRAKRFEAEHIMPAWEFGHIRECWQNSLLTDGRTNCESTDKEFLRQYTDLHNLYPAIGEVNKDRSYYSFTEVLPDAPDGYYGDCEIKISSKSKMVIPPERARGIIARAYLYMNNRYHIPVDKNHIELFELWNDRYPATPDECRRNELIKQVQGNSNPFVDRQCR